MAAGQSHIKAELLAFDRQAFGRWRDLVVLLVQRDLRVRYRGSFLGYLWSMMNPLLYMTILSFVFSHLMRFKIEHPAAFMLSGILCWNLFQQSLAIGVNSILNNGSLLRKVSVPAALFPAVSVCSVTVNFVLALLPFTIIALATGLDFSPQVFALPVLLLPYLIFIFGLTLMLGTLNIRFRDVGHTLEPLLQLLFYATPIVYPLEALPEKYRDLAWLNPLTPFISGIRDLMYKGTLPEPTKLIYVYVAAALTLALGVGVYRKNRDGFIYNL